MFAKNLEILLAELCQRGDVSNLDFNEFAVRFDALRRYRKLPPGRKNRDARLSSADIAAAIFGLVPTNPKWAGHAATILADLRPVGGVGASFCGAANLSEAVERLLDDDSSRRRILRLTMSVAEHATNSHGFATLVYREGEGRAYASYVSKMAMSQLQPGAERTFDIESAYAPMSRSVGFNRAFFERISSAATRTRAFSEAPAGDGSEYDAEEAEQARYKALGVQLHSRFLNIGVDTQVTWPKEETLVQFDRYHMVLMPKTAEHTQSIHVDLYANRLSDREATTVINRFLSVLAWCDDQFAVSQGGWSGNPIPVAVRRRNLAFVTAHPWVFDRKISGSDEVRRALALYREGLNAEEAALSSYAVLSYFKIIEIRYPDSEKARRWIRRTFPAIRDTDVDQDAIKRFIDASASTAPDEYIWSACRLAVAHASIKKPSDADEVEEISRLHTASYVLRRLARHLISSEQGVSDQIYSGD